MAHSQLTGWQQIWSRRVRRALIFGSLNSENEVGAIHNDVSGERWQDGCVELVLTRGDLGGGGPKSQKFS